MDLFQDPVHSRPNNEVLINKLGITTQQELREAEGRNLGQMALLVEGIKPIPGDFDAAHLKQIHKELLGTIYPWAGETRAWGQFQGQKHLPNGSLFFAPYQQIDTRLNMLGDQLKQENQLKGLDKDQFVKRLAYYADQYNYVHPFREGNGRTLQVVLAEVGRRAGYDVRISEQQIKDYNPARNTAILRKNGLNPDENLSPLRRLLTQATTPAEGPQAEQLRHPDLARPLPAPSPAMQQAEALRTIIVGSREVSEELVMQRVTKHDFKVTSDYMQQAKVQEAALVSRAQDVQREPSTWPEFRQHLLAQMKQVETDPGITRGSLAHLANVKKAGAELDSNQALTPAFREQEVPADQLARLGKPVEELWKRGQMEKLLQGQRTDQLPLMMPSTEGKLQQVTIRLQLHRDATGTVDLRVHLPTDIRELVMQAEQQSKTVLQYPQVTSQQQSMPKAEPSALHSALPKKRRRPKL